MNLNPLSYIFSVFASKKDFEKLNSLILKTLILNIKNDPWINYDNLYIGINEFEILANTQYYSYLNKYGRIVGSHDPESKKVELILSL